MVNKDEITIGINRVKSVLMTLIAFVIFSVTVWFITEILEMPSGFDKIFLLTGTSLLAINFAWSIVTGIKILLSNRGLIINDEGIKINIGPNRGQFFEWGKIVDVKIRNSIRGNSFLLIFVENPTEILRESRGLKRLLLTINNASHKTPVSITSTWLNSNLSEISEIVKGKIKKEPLTM